jgi:transcriptional regulator with XRE-family HTH domain
MDLLWNYYTFGVKQTLFVFIRCVKYTVCVMCEHIITMDRDAILKKIKLKRQALELSQDEVARALSLDRSQYTRIERGEAELSLDRLLKVMAFLSLKWSDFEESRLLPAGDLDSEEGIKRELQSLRSVISQIENRLTSPLKKEEK